jgi:hypothetical protein
MSKNMKWTLGLLVVGCMLAMAAPAGAAMMDSADFTWQYEMVNLPDETNLDGNEPDPPGVPTMDFTRLGGGTTTTDGNILTMTDSKMCYYYNNLANQTWQLDPNISYANGYTYEARLKVAPGSGSKGISFIASPEENVWAWLNISSGGQGWGDADVDVGEQLDNTDVYHVFRVAQALGAATYSVWRDGKLLSDSLGTGFDWDVDMISFGGYGDHWGGTFEIDYLRFTSGAYAPIPEPGTLVLLAGALMSLLVWRRR